MGPLLLAALVLALSLAQLVAVAATPGPTGAPGLRLAVYGNGAFHGTPLRTSLLSAAAFAEPLQGGQSVEVTGSLALPATDSYAFRCSVANATFAFLWVDDHLVCQAGAYGPWPNRTDDNPLRRLTKATLPFVLRVYAGPSPTLPAGATLAVAAAVRFQQQRVGPVYGAVPTPLGPWTLLSTAAANSSGMVLTSALSPVEVRRRELQAGLASGWGSWLFTNTLAMVKLPEGLAMAPVLCQASTGQCLEATYTGRGMPGNLRVGAHSYPSAQGRFAELDLDFNGLGIHIAWGSTSREELTWALTPNASGAVNRSDFSLRLVGSHAWLRPGQVHSVEANASLLFESTGFPALALRAHVGGSGGSPPATIVNGSLSIRLDGDHVVVSSDPACTNASGGLALVEAARARERATYTRYGALADTKEAVQAAVMWSLIAVPAELGPFAPVSRQWGFFVPDPISPEWDYVVFDWDNLLASYMFGALGEGEARASAYSSLIQVVRAKTRNGFVPNWSAAGRKSQDRSEEVIGSKVLLELYRAYAEAWLVELLFDDLYDWLAWVWERRLLGRLVTLGSDDIQGLVGDGHSLCSIQGARYEQADDGPGFDCPGSDPATGRPDGPGCSAIFNRSACRLELYNVGQTGLVTMELFALAELARAINRTGEEAVLRERGAALQALTRQHLWDAGSGLFVSRFASKRCPPNLTRCEDGFYRRIAPTSFFPLLGRAASDEQAVDMATHWLLNSTRFCLSPNGDFAGNTNSCYYGLPSIAADDPAFPLLGYWRGLVWAPWAQLVYWGLEEYRHVPAVAQAKASLARQHRTMFMRIWAEKRHVCENFSPHRDGGRDGDCTGTWFYHWGGLAGLLSLLEQQQTGPG